MTTEQAENKMEYCGGRGRGWRFLFIVPLVVAAVFGVGYIVMLLWNNIIPGLFPTLSIGTLTYWHALGLLILCKILFGGFRKGGHRGWRHYKQHNMYWQQKWNSMSEEEKAKCKEELKNRWRGRC